jgi:hypothetical protein
MLPFLRLHALAATRGDGLRPELRILLERLAEASEGVSNVAIADDRHPKLAAAYLARSAWCKIQDSEQGERDLPAILKPVA